METGAGSQKSDEGEFCQRGSLVYSVISERDKETDGGGEAGHESVFVKIAISIQTTGSTVEIFIPD